MTADVRPARAAPGAAGSPPIRFFYSHLHEAIRAELDAISRLALGLEPDTEGFGARLAAVEERCRFLEQIYKYHSVAEDEVVYPALESKVKNVTQAYSVEHDDEVELLEQLKQLLSGLAAQEGAEVVAAVREVICKLEEVTITLRKHLAKEEQQLYPLLLQHFSYVEQADLVAQFLCCIPLAAVARVLDWLKPIVPQEEQDQLVDHIREANPDDLLLQLLLMWLDPEQSQSVPPESDASSQSSVQIDEPDTLPPIQQIVNVHRSIGQALENLVQDAQRLLSGKLSAEQVSLLCEKHRFLRAVCWFHMLSEEEVMFPELGKRKIVNLSSVLSCQAQHKEEVVWFDRLGRLLADVKSSARRGANESAGLLQEVIECVEKGQLSYCKHMEKEEAEVLPLLQENLCFAEQCIIVWQTVRMMPLRLLERVMPWLMGQLSEGDAEELLNTLRIGAEGLDVDSAAVQLLSRWAQRGCRSPEPLHKLCTQDPSHYPNDTCEPKVVKEGSSTEADEQARKRRKLLDFGTAGVGGLPVSQPVPSPGHVGDASAAGGARHLRMGPKPIDHIFQFHRALKRDFRAFETEVCALHHMLDSGECNSNNWDQVFQKLMGRFRFLWSLYQAHSKIEDEVVFPALESKEALVNVCHSYVLDHKQEEELFLGLEKTINMMKPTGDREGLRELALELNRKCSAIRAALETHVRAEENELWPLFVENFSEEEQHVLVGSIIGRTGAEVLQAMLPWVSGCFSGEEMDAMKESLKSATRNTMFEQWLEAVGSPIGWKAEFEQPEAESSEKVSPNSDVKGSLVEVAQYLRRNLPDPGQAGEPSGPVAETSEFCPSWEDLFRMNQKQLEAAVRQVSNDDSLEPNRKTYLIQWIMVSKYVVAQQQLRCKGEAIPDEEVAEEEGNGAHRGATECSSHHRTFHDEQKGVLGCVHYQRRAALVAPCCSEVFTCRLCHDDKCDHRMNRYLVESMVCMVCGKRQPIGSTCSSCGASMANYYCSICHLFDDSPQGEIYHCPFCNVCRRGKGLGQDFFHCMECNACMHMSLFKRHKCREKCIEGVCPVCKDNLFDSHQPIKELRCGHFMHSTCFSQYSRWNYTCPICSKSMGDMCMYFRMLDSLLASHSMPDQFRDMTQRILCNDCGHKGEAPYHFVYHACPRCRSYNTCVL
eukprot:evm.model.scf_323EXC.4 EVM.evm.TU.scf_323EXC.4   scf_323EXC:18158-30601(+)